MLFYWAIAVRFNSAAISTSSSRKGALPALSGIWPQTKPEYWAGIPDKRQGFPGWHRGLGEYR